MSRRTQKNVGVIGLGIIGHRVAENLRRRGFSVFVWNRTPRPFPNFVGAPGEIAQLCDFIQIFVSDDDALLEVVQKLKQSLKAHHVVMAHSTVAPHTMRAAAEIVHRRGAQFLDAPFTGSKVPAEKGELVYYIGGDDAAFKRARPVLEASSKEIIEIGEIGQASTIKIATNMITATTVQAAAEALALVHNAGLSPDKFLRAMRDNMSNSATLSAKLPKMIESNFEPHFSVKHMLKDVQIASRLARSYGLTLGATETARDSLLEEARQNRGDYDYSSLVRFYFPEGQPAVTEPEVSEAESEQQSTLALDERAPENRAAEHLAEAQPKHDEFVEEPKLDSPAPEAATDDIPAAADIPMPEEPKSEEWKGEEFPTEASQPDELRIEASKDETPKHEPSPIDAWNSPTQVEPVPSFQVPTEEQKPAASTPTKVHSPGEFRLSDFAGEIDEHLFPEKRAEPKPALPEPSLPEPLPIAAGNEAADRSDDDPQRRIEEELEPAVLAERAEKQGERRGFFSRMFGKNPDYEESDY